MRREFVVYLDESFDKFMNLASLDGEIGYATLMIPRDREPALGRFWAALSERIRQEFRQQLGVSLAGEIKAGQMAKLNTATQREICRKIAYFVRKNDGVIAGFYTTVHGFICWELRTWNPEGSPLPPYTPEVIEQERTRIRSERENQPGEARLVQGLVQTLAAVPLNYIEGIGGAFRLHYDGRNRREDTFILDQIDEFFPKAGVTGPRFNETYLGSVAERDSSTSAGIQLTDLICRQIRAIFHDIPALAHEHSGFRIISPDSREGRTMATWIGSHAYKWGSARKMSESTIEQLRGFESSHPAGPLLAVLATQRLTCYAHYGESRVVNFRTQEYEDAVD